MVDMNMELSLESGQRLYEQIYEHIKREIKEGKLLQGEKLPSTRSLAEYLQVSRSTVDFAYSQLLSEGYIESIPCKGYFVALAEELFGMLQPTNPIMKSARKKERKDILLDFSPNAIDMAPFPFSVWKKLSREILSENQKTIFEAGTPQGDLELRETICRYLHSSRGVNCEPDQIIIGAGNDYLMLLLEKILGRHVKIAMENPTYKRAWHIFQSFAYNISTIDMDEFGMQVDKLREAEVSVAYVMPSHQFPTGIVMPIGRRMELLKWAEEEELRYLIEDDYDSEFRYKGKPIPSLQASDGAGKVIYMGTFSKSIAPAIRMSYMVLPMSLLEKYKKECYFFSSTVSRIDQSILTRFIKEGYFERHLNKMRKVYKGKHDIFLQYLKPFRKKFIISGENAGLHVLLTCKDGRTEEELINLAKEAGVKVYGLSNSLISAGKNLPQESSNELFLVKASTIILGYGGLNQEEMKQGIELLTKAWI